MGPAGVRGVCIDVGWWTLRDVDGSASVRVGGDCRPWQGADRHEPYLTLPPVITGTKVGAAPGGAFNTLPNRA
jgi:hypothetical protein